MVAEFPSQRDEPSSCDRLALVIGLKHCGGTLAPAALYELINDAALVGVDPDDLIELIARQFQSNPMRRFSEGIGCLG